LQRCRSYILGFLPQKHPFCETLQQQSRQNHGYQNSILFQFYETYQPSTIADVLKVESSRLSAYPAMVTVMPWSYSSPEERMARFCIEGSHSRLLSREAHKHGLNPAEIMGVNFLDPFQLIMVD
jgi:hypothetical protein